MGKNTRNFRQTQKSLSGQRGATSYAKISRANSLYSKVINFVKFNKNKGENY